MSKLTRKQQNALERAIAHGQRALSFINRADIAIARLETEPSTTLQYTRAPGEYLSTINKQIGSDLCGLEMFVSSMKQFLIDNS